MAKCKCPSCGEWYDGRKCRSCLYVHFEDEEKHDHYHGVYGETPPATQMKTPVVTAAPQVRKKTTASRKKENPPKKLLPLVVLPMILSLISSVFSFVSDFAEDFPDFDEEIEASVPVDTHALFAADGFRLMGTWLPGFPIEGDMPLTLVNESDREITVSIATAAVNGIMAEDVFLFATAEAGEEVDATLWVDMDSLGKLGIKVIETITLSICAYDAHTYEDLIPETVISLHTGETATVLPEYPLKTTLLADNILQLSYMGARDTEDGRCEFWFYAENNTDLMLSVCSAYIHADGIALDTFLSQDLLPHARALFCCTVEGAVSAFPELELEINAMDSFTWENLSGTGPLEIATSP